MDAGRFAHDTAFPAAPPARPQVWREVELLLLVLLVGGVYFSRLTDLTIRGEESRWARVAHEMIESGDWIVPRQQGEPFPDRPPLNSWAMIVAAQLTGGLGLLAIRLPSVTATLLTTLLIYWYGRGFMSRVGAFAAASAYATMGLVLQLGRQGESDLLLTLLLSVALLSWHAIYARLGSPRLAWIVGYTLAALAGLAKGPQGPIYFTAVTLAFLCLQRDWRFLFHPWHAVGLAVFAALVSAWQLPFLLEVDAAGAQAIWSEGGDIGRRFHFIGWRQALGHWSAYPFAVFGSMMPWSCLLLSLPTRWFRENVGPARAQFVFLLTACAVTFPTCWLPFESRPRYFMALYPCVALLIGLVIEVNWQSRAASWWLRSRDHFLLGGAALIVGAGCLVGISRWCGWERYGLGQAVSTPFAVVYAFAAAVAAWTIVRSRVGRGLARAQLGTWAIAAFMGLSYTGVVVSMQMRTTNDPSQAIASVRELVPPGENLVSLGPVHHLFAYYYQQPIELQKLSAGRMAQEISNTYFCFSVDPSIAPPYIPFAWERVAEISCERAKSNRPLAKVVVGKRRAEASDPLAVGSAAEEAYPFSPSESTAATYLDEPTRQN